MAVDVAPHWQEVEVVAAEPVAESIRRVVLRYPGPQVARPGTHVDIELPDPEHGLLTRSYSVVDLSADGRDLALSVHLGATSRGGSAAVHRLVPGDRLRATQPLQNFPLGVGAARYLLVAGGIGITALLAMARTLRSRGADYEIVYVGRTRAAMAYADRVLAEHGERARLHVDADGTPLDIGALLDGIAADPRARTTEVYLCGPIRLMDAVRRGWAERGLPVPNLRFETFGNSGAWAPQDFVVRVPRLDVETRVGADQTLLEALEEAGVDMMWDCRKGECGLCQVAVLEVDGQLDHRDVFLDEQEKGRGTVVCACVSRVVAHGTPRIDDAADVQPASTGGTAVLVIDPT